MARPRYTDITVRGVTYADTKAASIALGVGQRSVSRACRDGTLETLGMGRGHRPRMPVMIGGILYQDADAAAHAHGVGASAVYQALHRGQTDRLGVRAHVVPKTAIAVRIGPYSFSSLAALSRALGRRSGYASNLLKRDPVNGRQRLLGAVMAALEAKT